MHDSDPWLMKVEHNIEAESHWNEYDQIDVWG